MIADPPKPVVMLFQHDKRKEKAPDITIFLVWGVVYKVRINLLKPSLMSMN